MLSFLIVSALAALPTGDPRVSPEVAAILAGPLPRRDAVVVVEAAPGVEAHALADALSRWPDKPVVTSIGGPFVQLRTSWNVVAGLTRHPDVAEVRFPIALEPSTTTTQGFADLGVQPWHDLGITGAGARAAVVDVLFVGYEDLLGTELPADVTLGRMPAACTTPLGTLSDRHGQAVGEIIHDIAPDASLSFWCAQTDVELIEVAEAIAALPEPPHVVNASVGIANLWATDGTSPWSQAVSASIDAGSLWTVSVGNTLSRHWTGVVTDDDGDGVLEFEGQEALPIRSRRGSFSVIVRWDEPFGAADEDVDIRVFDSQGAACGVGGRPQDGTGDPLETVTCTGATGDGTLVMESFDDGAGVGRVFHVYSAYGLPAAWQRPAGSLLLPSDAHGALAVSSVHRNTTELSPARAEGPTDDGRIKPDVMAPTDVRTTSYGAFSGTSAAAPHVAGAVALLVDASDGAFGPAELADQIRARGEDHGAVGPDTTWGWGILRLECPPGGCDPDTGTDTDTDTGTDTGTGTDTDTDSDTDSDSDSDVDSDSDAGTDTDTGSGTDIDTDTGTGTGTSADTDTDTDTDADVDTDTDTDTMSPIRPCGCATDGTRGGTVLLVLLSLVAMRRRSSAR